MSWRTAKGVRGETSHHFSTILFFATHYSVGDTLKGWVEDLQAEGVNANGVEWTGDEGSALALKLKLEEKEEEGAKVVRLFAFGMEKMRKKVRKVLRECWRVELDLFVS